MRNIHTLSNIKKIKWGFLEENKPIHLYPVMYPGWSYIIEKTGRILGRYQNSIINLNKGLSGKIFVDHKEWIDLGVFTLKKIIRNPKFATSLNRTILQFSDRLVNFTSEKIFKVNLKKKTNKELISLYKEYEKHHGELYIRAIIPVYLDLYKPHLTKYLIDYLFSQIEKIHCPKTAKKCFTILTVPEKPSQVQLEEKALLRIAKQIMDDSKARRLFKQNIKNVSKKLNTLDKILISTIKKHIEAHRYLGYNFEGPAFPEKYFLVRWQELILKNTNISLLLQDVERKRNEIKQQQNRIIKDLRIDRKHQLLFQITREIIYGKDYRKMSLVKAYYQIEPLLKEICRRTHLSLNEVRNCLINELGNILAKKIKKPKDLDQRMKKSLFVVINRTLPGRVFTGELFVKTKNHLSKEEDLSEVNYFHGQTAATGKARGAAKIINSVQDLPKMKKGNILVSQMTNPDLVPAMKKAAAIITDLGGITCHAAIVSRELGIPCVIGTKIATKVLKDGDRVFVDADQGEVKRII